MDSISTIKLFCSQITSLSTANLNNTMSSAKRRKVDNKLPSGLLENKKHVAKELAPTSASTSPEPAGEEEPKEKIEEEATKTFKDLVRVSNIKDCK